MASVIIQKQSPKGILKKGLKNFKKFKKKTPVLEFPFWTSNFIEKKLYYTCFTLNFAKLFRTPFHRALSCNCFERLKLPINDFAFEFKPQGQLHVKQKMKTP